MTEPPNHQHRMVATIVNETTFRAPNSIVASQGRGDGGSIRLIDGPAIPGPTTPRLWSLMAAARWGHSGRPPDEIAMRRDGAMWPHDNDDDGGSLEMIEHDNGTGGGGGNCGMLSKATPLWEHVRRSNVR